MTSSQPRQGRPAFRVAQTVGQKGQSSVICHPSSVERGLAISTFLSL